MMGTKDALQAEAERLDKKFGHRTGSLGSASYQLNVVPTGILSLDYALGTGGWPLGHLVEVFGSPDIGKSTIMGFGAIRSAQQQGMTCGLIALEPGFDTQWAIKNGIDPEMLVVARPDNGEDAFHILHDWVTGDLVDFTVFDSIGAVLRSSETEPEGKAAQGGQSGLITWGTNRIVTPAWKNNKGVMFLNQQRDDMRSRIPGQVEAPGGWALKHFCNIRIHLKAGRERFTEKVNGEDILAGRQLVAVIKRNKLAEGTNHRAVFNFYQMDTEHQSVGIDTTTDVLNTAMQTGVISRAGAIYQHPAFPDGKLKGKNAVAELFAEDPSVVKQLRDDVMDAMVRSRGNPQNLTPEETLEAENG